MKKIIKNIQTNESDVVLKTVENKKLICGYASIFDYVDQHGDIVKYGAFDSAQVENIKFLWQHDSSHPIGKIHYLEQDKFGLYIEVMLDMNVAKAREAYSLVKSKIISGLSIGFAPVIYKYNKDNNRVILSANLIEVSLVTFPANDQANITDVKQVSDICAIKQLNKNLDDAFRAKVFSIA